MKDETYETLEEVEERKDRMYEVALEIFDENCIIETKSIIKKYSEDTELWEFIEKERKKFFKLGINISKIEKE